MNNTEISAIKELRVYCIEHTTICNDLVLFTDWLSVSLKSKDLNSPFTSKLDSIVIDIEGTWMNKIYWAESGMTIPLVELTVYSRKKDIEQVNH